MRLFNQLDSDWKEHLADLRQNFDAIDRALDGQMVVPAYPHIMRALTLPIDQIRVVIFGQDPYPTPGHAHGLAFSVANGLTCLPPTLRNIFRELEQDCNITLPPNPDLTRWADQGVLLLNRILTTKPGRSLAHADLGWQVITDEVAKVLGTKPVVAILWGKSASELGRFFSSGLTISCAHPSPLSAYRGFFGSHSFSRCNQILHSHGFSAINW